MTINSILRSVFLIVFTIFFSFNTQAQTVTTNHPAVSKITLGKTFKSAGNYGMTPIGIKDGRLYSVSGFDDNTLEVVDSNGEFVSSWSYVNDEVDLANRLSVKSFYCGGFLLMNKEVLVFTSYRDRKTKTVSIYVKRLDLNTLEVIESVKTPIYQYQNEHPSFVSGQSRFNVIKSDDGSTFAILVDTPRGDKDPFENEVVLFDSALKEISRRKFDMNFTGIYRRWDDLCLTNEGVIYGQYEERGPSDPTNPSSRSRSTYGIAKLDAKSNEVKKFTIRLENYKISTKKMKLNNANELELVGYYFNDSVVGVFVATEDESELNFKTQVVNRERLQYEFETEQKEIDKSFDEFNEHEMGEMFYLKDGSTVLFTEAVYSTSRSGSSTYHYNDLYITKLNPSNEIEWITVVNKAPLGSIFMNEVTYAAFVNEDNAFVIFNHNTQFFNPAGELLPGKNVSGGFESTALSTIDLETGRIKTNLLFDQIMGKNHLVEYKCYPDVENNSLFIKTRFKKTAQYGKIYFN